MSSLRAALVLVTLVALACGQVNDPPRGGGGSGGAGDTGAAGGAGAGGSGSAGAGGGGAGGAGAGGAGGAMGNLPTLPTNGHWVCLMQPTECRCTYVLASGTSEACTVNYRCCQRVHFVVDGQHGCVCTNMMGECPMRLAAYDLAISVPSCPM